MDIFQLLSRGANLDKRGKHEKDLLLFKSPENSQESVQKVDFFKRGRKRRPLDLPSGLAGDDDEEEEEEDGSGVEPTISTAEQALIQRKSYRVNISGDDIPLPIGRFSDLQARFNIEKPLLRAIVDQQFNSPTAIQTEAISIMLHGRDILACAPTGSGKTWAFAIPLVQSLKRHDTSGVRALVISPTKELALQIFQQISILSKGTNLTICILSRAAAAKIRTASRSASQQKFDILITTPLRLIDCIQDSSIDLSKVKHIVLDEADKLFDQGFLEQTDRILGACTASGLHKALFSATMPSGVEQIASAIMHSPVRVIIGLKEAASSTIDQKLIYTGNEHGKLIAIRQMVQEGQFVPPVLIFVQSIARAKALFHELIYDKINVDAIHSERTQTQRDKVIEQFKTGEIWCLICTDVLSRGIDFHGVNLVINYDIPQTAQSYVHRIGRTGRAGRNGKAITFFTKDDRDAVKAVVNVMKQSGCDVADWMLNMPKISQNEKKKLKQRPVDRANISTVPGVIRMKRKNLHDKIAYEQKKLRTQERGELSEEIKSNEVN